MKDVQSILEFGNFHCRFIEGLLPICKPMMDPTKTTVPTSNIRKFEWTKEYEGVFTELKARFTAALIRWQFDPTLQCILETNASDFVIRVVLSQVHSRELHLVAFYSGNMGQHEVNYDIHHKEIPAIVSSFKQWRYNHHRAAHMVLVYSGHKELE